MVTNHQSFLDPWLIGIALPRQLHYMARDTLFKGGFLQFLGELWNAFPVRRGAADLSAIRTAAQRLDAGFIVNIFPEGTRSVDGSIGPVAPGISLILNRCESQIPIMPVVIDGAFEAWPRNARFPGPHGIRVEYGRVISPTEWRALSPQQLAGRIRHELILLQESLHSSHAASSRRRFEEDMAQEAKQPVKSRRRGG